MAIAMLVLKIITIPIELAFSEIVRSALKTPTGTNAKRTVETAAL
jgi:hypothetical protein